MATSSITHNFVVSNPNSVKRFVAAIDEADRDRTPKQTPVSYTHLDVYKRQLLLTPLFTISTFMTIYQATMFAGIIEIILI